MLGVEGWDKGHLDVSSQGHANLICKLFLIIKINKLIHSAVN